MILLFQKLEIVAIGKIETQVHVITAALNSRCLKAKKLKIFKLAEIAQIVK